MYDSHVLRLRPFTSAHSVLQHKHADTLFLFSSKELIVEYNGVKSHIKDYCICNKYNLILHMQDHYVLTYLSLVELKHVKKEMSTI